MKLKRLPGGGCSVLTVSMLVLPSVITAQQGSVPASPSQPSPQVPAASLPSPVGDSGKSSATTNVNSSDVKTDNATADRSSLPATVPANRPVIGVALEGGGALGLAHIGVLQWFEEHHIPVDRLSGTSMGALIGGLYASGMRADELQKVGVRASFFNVFTLRVPYEDVSFRRREDRRELPQALTLGLRGGPSLRNALISDNGLNEFLRTHLASYNRSELSFDTLPIPFRCISTDLNTMRLVVFDGGPMPQAIRSSISIPGVFSPVQYHEHYLADGAIMDNLPTDIVRKDLHSDVVIGVHLEGTKFEESDVSSIVGVFSRAYAAGTARNERQSEGGADVLIQADTSNFGVGDYGKGAELIAVGYKAAASNGAALLKYALNDADWQAYLQDRGSRERPRPGLLQVVKVEGGPDKARERVALDTKAMVGKPINPPGVADSLRNVQGNGTFQASYETFNTANQSPVDRSQATGPDDGIVVRLSHVRSGPPFLLVGLDATAANSNVSRGTFDFRLLNTDFGGFGSELRIDVRLGFLTQFSSEYYRLLTPSGYFVKPKLGILRQPVYLWSNQVRISEHLEQQAGGGLELGRTYNRHLQLSAEYRAQVVRWHPVSGQDGTPVYSGTAQTATTHVSYDSTKSGQISTSGFRLAATAGALFNTIGSRTAPVVQLQGDKIFHLGQTNIIGFSGEADTYFRRYVAEPLRFTAGGPLRLSASSIDEYRGTDMGLIRTAYLHRIAVLPSGFGEGIYAALGYEAASTWAPERHSILRQDGLLTVVGATPFGAVTFGFSAGDAGRRKIFFNYGRLF